MHENPCEGVSVLKSTEPTPTDLEAVLRAKPQSHFPACPQGLTGRIVSN